VAWRPDWVVAWPGEATTDSGSDATPDPRAGGPLKASCASAGFAGRLCWAAPGRIHLGSVGPMLLSFGGHAPLGGACLRQRGGGWVNPCIPREFVLQASALMRVGCGLAVRVGRRRARGRRPTLAATPRPTHVHAEPLKTICASVGFAGGWCWGGAWADSLGEGGLNAPSLGGHAPLGGACLRRRGGGRIRTRIFHSLCSGTLRARASDVAWRSQWVLAWPGEVTTDSGSGATPDPHAGKAFETIVGQRLSLRSCIMLSPMLKQDAVQPVTVEMSIPSAIHSGSYYTGCALKRCPATERRNRGR
jgi:hypothetical protein